RGQARARAGPGSERGARRRRASRAVAGVQARAPDEPARRARAGHRGVGELGPHADRGLPRRRGRGVRHAPLRRLPRALRPGDARVISVKQVPRGWAEIARDDYDAYVKFGSPMLQCGLGFYVPTWARRLVHDWPATLETAWTPGRRSTPAPQEPRLLGQVVRALALD